MRCRLPAGRVRIVAVDETRLWVRGKSRPAKLVVRLDRRMLGLELTGTGFDYRQWFRDLSAQLGVEVVATDDAIAYAGDIDDARLKRQQYMVHMQRTLGGGRGAETGLAGSLGETTGANVPTLAVHPQEPWRQMTLHQREPGVPDTTKLVGGTVRTD